MNQPKSLDHNVATVASGIRLPVAVEYPGIIAARFPTFALVLVVLLSILAVRGIMELRADNALNGVFRSNSTTFQNFARLAQNFPQSDDTITLSVSAASFDQRKTLEALRDLHYELALSDGVAGVFSIFTIRGALGSGEGMPPPLIPEPLPETADVAELMADVRRHPLVEGRLLTRRADETADITIFMVSPNYDRSLVQLIDDIRGLGKQFKQRYGLKIGLTGTPVIRTELALQASQDRILFLSFGLAVGFIICLLFFRRLDFLIIANIPSVICVYWSLSAFGAAGVKINPIMTALLPLLMVVAFTNAMHILFVLRRQLLADRAIVPAVQTAVRAVGPACFISALTTMLAFISIAQADAEIIRTFGLAAAGGTALSYLAVIIVVPALAVVLLRLRKTSVKSGLAESPGLVRLDKMASALADVIVARAWIISAISIVSLGLAIWLYASLTPQYRLSDMMPTDGEAKIVAQELSQSLSGINPIHVMMSWDGESDIPTLSSRVLSAIAEADATLRKNDLIDNVWSLETLRPLVVTSGVSQGATSPEIAAFAQAVLALPESITERLINFENKVALITGFTADLEAKAVVALKRSLVADLSHIAQNYPGISFSITGGAVLSAEGSLSVINQLYISLILAMVIVTIVMVIAFRSFAVGLLSLVPNLFAVTATGGMLYVLGWGLEYAGIISLTVAFGLAVDDTIHVFNRHREISYKAADVAGSVRSTVQTIGPVLILTTIVLFLGICASATSGVPPTRLFGQIFMSTVVFALIGDLIVLPALIIVAGRLGLKVARKNAAVDGKP